MYVNTSAHAPLERVYLHRGAIGEPVHAWVSNGDALLRLDLDEAAWLHQALGELLTTAPDVPADQVGTVAARVR